VLQGNGYINNIWGHIWGTIFEDPYQTQIGNGSSFNEQHNYSRSASYYTTVVQKQLKEKDMGCNSNLQNQIPAKMKKI
jgi:hypothetical protein